MTNNEQGFLLSVETDVGELVFNSLEELEGWLQNYNEKFGWIGAITDQQPQEMKNAYNSYYSGVGSHINAIRQRPEQLSDRTAAISQAFHTFFATNKGISGESPHAGFVRSQRELHGELSAAWSLYTLRTIDPPRIPTTMEGFKGIYRAIAYEAGDGETSESVRNEIAEQKLRFDREFAIQLDELRSTSQEQKNKKEQFIFSSDELLAYVENRDRDQIAIFAKYMQECEEGKSTIEETYRNALSLRAPVEYWQQKANEHKETMKLTGIFAMGLAIVFIVFPLLAKFIINGAVSEAKITDVAFFATISTVLIWAIRIATKIAVANLHLKDDAIERVTMMKAYLALMKDGESGLTGADKDLVLGSLFRPSSSGLVSDDGMHSPIEIVNKIVKRSQT